MEGTNKAHDNGEAMGFVGVRLTAQLGHGLWYLPARFLPEILAIIAFAVSTTLGGRST